MKHAITYFWLACILAVTQLYGQNVATDTVRTVIKIWDKAPHNGFPDLIRFKKHFYVALREGNSHMPDKSGKVRIIRSKDGKTWESVALFEVPNQDVRDARLSVTPEGQIMMVTAVGVYNFEKKAYEVLTPMVTFSDNKGMNFKQLVPIRTEGFAKNAIDWLWRVTWHKGIGYGVLYRIPPVGGLEALLLETRDGNTFKLLKQLDIKGSPNESTVRFDANDKMYVLVRRDRMGMLATSLPPYRDWNYTELKVTLGGPELMIYDQESLLIGTRFYQDKKTSTAVLRTNTKGDIQKIIRVPSGGDTSYPGFLHYKKKLWMVYYSSHEGKSNIYLAQIPDNQLKIK